ncbi:hypothetical protein QVD99_007649 [Batrachochytrium dendrobatidis]|nr:hypothetical protein O5D80_008247 [Batrachochytrium dendrobatidis]KAK5666036.1 hypothetical protein QVD99_007649 [Batrachochytrium dendrobatidis]
MIKPSQHIVQATVFEGRNFTRQPGSKVYVQCRFNNEILTTDPADHLATPIWDTELAWDVDTKLLGFLRSQRVSLKLICYSIDIKTNKRESLGYIMLDLRAAIQGPPPFPEKWFTLVNIKSHPGGHNAPASVFRPELKISFTVQPKHHDSIPSVQSTLELEGRRKKSASNDQIAQRSSTELPSTASTAAATRTQSKLGLSSRKNYATIGPVSNSSLGTIPQSNPNHAVATSIPFELKSAGFYQLGTGDQLFCLWITIAFGEHLELLLDDAQISRQTNNTGYYFYYSFMGNDIMTQRFYQLDKPNFPAERVSVKLRASQSDIQTFFREISKIIIYLCHEDRAIGFADIPICNLLDNNGGEMAVIEQAFPLYNTREELPLSADAKSSSIGVSMALSRDTAEQSHGQAHTQEQEEFEPDQDSMAHQHARDQAPIPHTRFSHPGTPVNNIATFENLSFRPALDYENKTTNATTPIDSTLATLTRDGNPNLQNAFSTYSSFLQSAKPISVTTSKTTLNRAISPQMQPTKDMTDPLQGWHQYRFSIELRSLRDIQFKSANVYLKYTYAPFGTSSPILTHPIVHIQRTPNEHLLPHSFCAFEFVMSLEKLSTYLEAVPLIVELWQKDENVRDVNLGSALVNLSLVLSQTKIPSSSIPVTKSESYTAEQDTQQLVIQSLDTFVPLMSTGDSTSLYGRLADLRVVLALEDFGVVKETSDADSILPQINHQNVAQDLPSWKDVQTSAAYTTGQRTDVSHDHPLEPSSYKSTLQHQHKHGGMLGIPSQPNPSTPTPSSIHDTPEYQTAIELELWRQQEQQKFTQYLAEKEIELTQRLAGEWKLRDREREALLKRKLDDYKQLETALQQLSSDLERRESVLVEGERELIKQRERQDLEVLRALDEARDATRRLQEEFRYRTELEKQKCAEADAMRNRAIRDRDEMEAKWKTIDSELSELKRSLGSSGEAKAKIELGNAMQDKMMLEKQIEALKKNKAHYKCELKRVYKLLTKEREKARLELEQRMIKDRQDIEDMRMQAIAKEQLSLAHTERETLEHTRRDLEALGRAVYASQSSNDEQQKDVQFQSSMNNHQGTLSEAQLPPKVSSQISRLKKEKTSLLSTGFYKDDDDLIREFDHRIANLMKSAM